MSTFTDWNGPNGSNVRASDLIELAGAYQRMLSELHEHIAATPSANDVHKIKEYIEPIIAEYVKLSELTIRLNSYYTKLDADDKFALKSAIPDLTPYVKLTDIADFVATPVLDAYLKKSDLSSQQAVIDLQNAIAEINAFLEGNEVEFNGVVKSKQYIEGLIHALEQIQFTDKKFNAHIGGSDSVGVYYILGMLMDKAGTAYIKYENTKPFSAAINFAVTPDYKGALSVTTDGDLAGLKFKIVSGTRNGEKHAYLAVQSTEWIQNFASTDGVGKFDVIEFFGAGINFIPVDSEGYVKPNADCHDVVDCYSGPGFSTSSFAVNEFKSITGKTIFKVVEDGGLVHLVLADNTYTDIQLHARPYLLGEGGGKTPFVTISDIKAIDNVGTIVYWPSWEEDGDKRVAKDFPGIYLACDGSTFDENEYPTLAEVLGGNVLPVVDYCIIKAKNLIEVINTFNAPGGSLADAVATIHGTQVYKSADELPSSVPDGTLAIVSKDGLYYVYKKVATGWEVQV